MSDEYRSDLIMSNTASDGLWQKQPRHNLKKTTDVKSELKRAYGDYRKLQDDIANYVCDDNPSYEDLHIDSLRNDFKIAWGKYWDACVLMSTGRYKEFRGRTRLLRYALVKYRAGDRAKLLRLDPAYLKSQRLPLPNANAGQLE